MVISNTLWVGEQVPCLTYGMRGMISLSIEVCQARKPRNESMAVPWCVFTCEDLRAVPALRTVAVLMRRLQLRSGDEDLL